MATRANTAAVAVLAPETAASARFDEAQAVLRKHGCENRFIAGARMLANRAQVHLAIDADVNGNFARSLVGTHTLKIAEDGAFGVAPLGAFECAAFFSKLAPKLFAATAVFRNRRQRGSASLLFERG